MEEKNTLLYIIKNVVIIFISLIILIPLLQLEVLSLNIEQAHSD